jgi:hypothetical protein
MPASQQDLVALRLEYIEGAARRLRQDLEEARARGLAPPGGWEGLAAVLADAASLVHTAACRHQGTPTDPADRLAALRRGRRPAGSG